MSIPEGFPVLVDGSWPCNADGSIVCLKKYVISGVTVTTSDGTEHAIPVSEFRVAPLSANLGDTDCHFVETGDDAANLVALEAQILGLGQLYEDGVVSGVDSVEVQSASEEILQAWGYNDGETVDLPSGRELTA